MSFVGRVATRRFAFSSSRRKKRRVSTRPAVLLALLLCAFSATAAPPEIEGQWKQGELLRGHVAPGSQLRFKGQRVNVGDDGLFIIGLDRDEPATVELEVIDPDGTAHKSTHAVAARQYKIQRIDGLPPSQVSPEDPVLLTRIAAEGDSLPIVWRHRDERYVEKLATPDTSVADLIGDVDPVRVAEGRRLGDPETIHYGLIPRAHRGIVAINELPDLAERIQVAMLNVMEERDVQIRGYVLRLPLDVLVVASANPEDYTNRGRIITPLQDRFGAEIRTHYPLDLADEIEVVRQEAELTAEVPDALMELLARFTRELRTSDSINQASGVSARFAIARSSTRRLGASRCISSAARNRPSRSGGVASVSPAARRSTRRAATSTGPSGWKPWPTPRGGARAHGRAHPPRAGGGHAHDDRRDRGGQHGVDRAAPAARVRGARRHPRGRHQVRHLARPRVPAPTALATRRARARRTPRRPAE